MRQLISVLRSVWIALAGFTLVCIWTGVLYFQNNSSQLAQVDFASEFVLVMALCGVLWLLGIILAVAPSLLSPDWSVSRAFSTCTAVIFFLFSHEAIRYWLSDHYQITGNAGRIIYLIIVAGVLAASWRMFRHQPFRVMFAITAALLTIFSIASVMQVTITIPGYPSSMEHVQQQVNAVEDVAVHSRKNIYYVILDAYGGPPALKKYLNIDVMPFVEKMVGLGYSYLDASRANYTVTYVSLAATLNMNYILNTASPRYADRANFYPSILNKNQLPDIFKKLDSLNYNFIHVGNEWAPCRELPKVACLAGQNISQFERVSNRYLAPTKFIDGFGNFFSLAKKTDIDALTPFSRALSDIATQKRPSFVFVHHLIPHEPLEKNCSRSIDGLTRESYKNSIECVNDAVLNLARLIQKTDPNAVVVFQADHGSGLHANFKAPFDQWDDTAIKDRVSILNLIHLPEQCRKWLRSDLSPINTIRLVFGCIENRPPNYLPEHSYLTAYETSADFGMVKEVSNILPQR